jgi:type IV secretion system protein VirB1
LVAENEGRSGAMNTAQLRHGLYLAATGAGVVLALVLAQWTPRGAAASTSASGSVTVSSSPPARAPVDRIGGAARSLQLALNRLPAAQVEETDATDETPRLSRRALRDLADRCAPTTPQSVLTSIVAVESDNNPLAIGVNGPVHLSFSFKSRTQAIAKANALIAEGRSIDLGLAQISSRNLTTLGLTVADAFDACRNIASASKLIDRDYAKALNTGPQHRPLLQSAYSAYNTGDALRGQTNGYVDMVEAAARIEGRPGRQ